MVLDVIDDEVVELTRAAAWPCPVDPSRHGVSSLSARVAIEQLDGLVEAMNRSQDEERTTMGDRALLVLDQVLLPDRAIGRGDSATARLFTRSLRVLCPPLVLDVDASISAAMPADVRLWHIDAPPPASRETLASGASHPGVTPAARMAIDVHERRARTVETGEGAPARPARAAAPADELRGALHQLPDDLLAVRAVDWRVLRWQGGYWKGALALPRRGRQARLQAAGHEAMAGLQDIVSSPHDWHTRHRDQRRRVFVRRLKPFMALGAILAVMPIAWLATSRGGIELHPLLLGITPLLMVGMIALSAREIPVMEWPPRPTPLPDPALDMLSSVATNR